MCCCHGLPFNVLGVVFSLVALGQIRNDPRSEQGQPIAIAGLVLSLLSLLLAASMFMLGLALHTPGMMHRVYRL